MFPHPSLSCILYLAIQQHRTTYGFLHTESPSCFSPLDPHESVDLVACPIFKFHLKHPRTPEASSDPHTAPLCSQNILYIYFSLNNHCGMFIYISPTHRTIPETLCRYPALRALNAIIRTWRLILSYKRNCWESMIKGMTQCRWYFKKKTPRGDHKIVMGRTDWMQDNQHGRQKTAAWHLLYIQGLRI